MYKEMLQHLKCRTCVTVHHFTRGLRMTKLLSFNLLIFGEQKENCIYLSHWRESVVYFKLLSRERLTHDCLTPEDTLVPTGMSTHLLHSSHDFIPVTGAHWWRGELVLLCASSDGTPLLGSAFLPAVPKSTLLSMDFSQDIQVFKHH